MLPYSYPLICTSFYLFSSNRTSGSVWLGVHFQFFIPFYLYFPLNSIRTANVWKVNPCIYIIPSLSFSLLFLYYFHCLSDSLSLVLIEAKWFNILSFNSVMRKYINFVKTSGQIISHINILFSFKLPRLALQNFHINIMFSFNLPL